MVLHASRAPRPVLLIAAIAVILFATAAVAVAKPQLPVEHCVIEVIGQHDSGEFITTEPVCYDTFAEAIAHATGGEVVLDAATPGSVVFDPGFTTLSSTSLVGIHYDGYNGTGASISVAGSVCSGGYWNTTPSWDNRISSSWNGCPRLRHYDYANMGGSSGDTVGAGSTRNVPSWINNKAESVQYRSS